MSAFANTLGGALIFGMADDGQIVGLTEPDSDAENLRIDTKIKKTSLTKSRNGHCARRRVSERNRRTAAALSAEIDTRPTFLPEKGLFRQTEAGEHFCSPAFYGL